MTLAHPETQYPSVVLFSRCHAPSIDTWDELPHEPASEDPLMQSLPDDLLGPPSAQCWKPPPWSGWRSCLGWCCPS